MPPSRSRAPASDRGGTQEDLRRHNLGTALTHLHLSGPLTRAELTARMGLNRSTIAALVNELAGLGAVREERPAGARPGAGRPSLVVRPADDRVQALAVDVGVDRVVVGLVGLGGRVLVRRRRRVLRRNPAAVVGLIRQLADVVLAHPAAAGPPVAVGVSVPGAVRHTDGCVRFAPNLGWVDEPFGSLLGERFAGLPVVVANDADLGALAEHRRGVARGVDDVVFIACEVGVGGGLIVAGRPLAGAGGYAGEVGHILVRPDGRRCHCGSRGCWETEIGAGAVAQALGLGPVDSRDLVRAVRSATASGGGPLHDIAHHLGTGLATLVNVLNPGMVIVGGVLRELFPACAGTVRQAFDAAALAAPAAQVTIVTPALGGDAVLVGAAEVAWESVLADPAGALRGSGASVGPA